MFNPTWNKNDETVIPTNLKELHSSYANDEACHAWATDLRECPSCEGKLWWRPKRLIWRCQNCGRDVPLNATTALGELHVPLPTTFDAAWCFADKTVSARKLGATLGLSRPTVHGLLSAFRGETTRWAETQVLSGDVEVDETFLDWNKKRGNKAKGRAARPIVMILAERGAGGSILKRGPGGRVIAVQVKDASARTCEAIVQRFVKAGSNVHTDAWRGYKGLNELGYKHIAYNVSASTGNAHVYLPAVHSAANQLKTALKIYSRHPTLQYFPLYLGEWSWRYSNRYTGTGERWAQLIKMINERRMR